MALITISRQYGAGGSVVGAMVAARMGWRLFDHSILSEVALSAKISTDSVERLERMAGDRFLEAVTRYLPGYANCQNPDARTSFNLASYREVLDSLFKRIAQTGSAVVVGRGAQFVLRKQPGTIRVLLIADEATRIKSLKTRYGFDEEQALDIARRQEKKRLNFLKSFKAGDPSSPLEYHAVINTGLMPYKQAAEQICGLAEKQL